jgi:hypothetical protein
MGDAGERGGLVGAPAHRQPILGQRGVQIAPGGGFVSAQDGGFIRTLKGTADEEEYHRQAAQ